MGTFQMAILLCFNEKEQLQVKDIQEQTQLPDKELIKQIQSLLESKLLQSQNENDLEFSSIVTLNKDYTNKRTKFKITAAIQKETPQVNNPSIFSSKVAHLTIF